MDIGMFLVLPLLCASSKLNFFLHIYIERDSMIEQASFASLTLSFDHLDIRREFLRNSFALPDQAIHLMHSCSQSLRAEVLAVKRVACFVDYLRATLLAYLYAFAASPSDEQAHAAPVAEAREQSDQACLAKSTRLCRFTICTL